MIEPVVIKPKAKYLRPKFCKQNKASSGNSGNTKRNKLNQTQKKALPPQPKKVMLVNGGSGSVTMVTV